ncbi:MAG: hypothetical protein KC502_17155, partial [Myxococcales bacterium]|nr:hypothetical protein [Myxococcales bacterium]
MGPATLIVIGPEPALDACVAAAARQLPFLSPEMRVHQAPAGDAGRTADDVVRVVQWSPRSPHRHPAAQTVTPDGAWLACSGWWLAADLAPSSGGLAGAAPALLAEAAAQRLWPLSADVHGQGALFWQRPGGPVSATCDYHGGGLLFHGTAGGVTALGSRAMLVAAALNPTHGPELEPAEALWPLTKMGAPLGAETAWRGVQLLAQGARLDVKAGEVAVTCAPPLPQNLHSFDDLTADLLRRPLALDAYPDHPVEVMLSGGKDIRLVLAAMAAANRLGRVTTTIMWAPEGDPDLAVGRQLASALGLPLELRDSPVSAGPWQEGFLRHAFLGEAAVHAWDRKGTATVRDVVTLNGYFGELYKSHVQRSFALGGWAQRRFYGRNVWFDRHNLLTDKATSHLRARFDTWLTACRQENHPWDLLHDRWHREARMQRWVGHILRAEACANPWLQLLPSQMMLERYVTGPLADRTQHRQHYEMLRRLAPELLELPLAEDRWSGKLDRKWTPPAAQRRVGAAPCAQAAQWQRHGREMADWLRSGKDDGMMA